MIEIRQVDELSPLEKLALIDMSYSRLSTYEMCNLKYWYSYITREPRVFSAPATLGNVIHGVLEQHAENLDLDVMNNEFITQRAKYDPDNQIDDRLIEVGHAILAEYIDRHEGEEFQILSAEQSFGFVIGSAYVNGYIDRIDRDPDGRIRIVDYKSGSWEVPAKNIATDLQLGIYALAASLMYPGDRIYAELYYLRSGRRKGHEFTPEDLERVADELADKVYTVINDSAFLPTEDTQPCSFCDYRKSGLCKVGIKRRGTGKW